MPLRFCLIAAVLLLTTRALSCDLCAIYSASSAMGQSGSGFSLSLAEQFIPFRTVRLDGEELPSSILDKAFLDRSMTHLAATWNFSERFGLSLSLPIVHENFRRLQLTSTNILTKSGLETGIGDLALIARVSPIQKVGMKFSVILNVLAGLKFPTGDDEHLRDEVASTRELDAVYGVGHQHAVSGVHSRDLALGSGSYDGVFGLTLTTRWDRWILDAQLQYYLRTKGVSGYEFGDELMISGGPGVFVVLARNYTIRAQALIAYDTTAQDKLLGRKNQNSGMTALYLGPQLIITIGGQFSVNGGVDVPLNIENHGLQNVPDYRIHAGLSWRF